LKDIELKLISALVNNSRKSDRELAKVIGVSQPTITRTRIRLEKEGLFEYTAIPNLAKLGFDVIAVTFGKRDYTKHPEINLQKSKDFAKRHPSIIFGGAGNGLGYDRIVISTHRKYSDYTQFLGELRNEWTDTIDIKDSFIVSLKSKEVIQPLSLKNLAESLKKEG